MVIRSSAFIVAMACSVRVEHDQKNHNSSFPHVCHLLLSKKKQGDTTKMLEKPRKYLVFV